MDSWFFVFVPPTNFNQQSKINLTYTIQNVFVKYLQKHENEILLYDNNETSFPISGET